MLENKWRHGKVALMLPALEQRLITSPGIKALSLTLDPAIGSECVLLITEPRPQVSEFEGRNISGFWMKSGLVKTAHGPLFWLLFYFPSPATGQNVVYENAANPKDPSHIAIWKQLANQRYWHIIISDTDGIVVNFFEFRNDYGLEEAISQVQLLCEPMGARDFMKAKAEYQAAYSIDTLMRMGNA